GNDPGGSGRSDARMTAKAPSRRLLVGAASGTRRGAVGVERGAAGTAADRVRVVDREAGAHQRVDVVNLGAVHVLGAEGVDHHRNPGVIFDLVVIGQPVVEREPVAESGAATGLDEKAEARFGLALAGTKLLDLGSRDRKSVV